MRNDVRYCVSVDTPRVVDGEFIGLADLPARRARTRAAGMARWLALLGWSTVMLGSAQAATFTISKLYSDQAGNTQYIELHESSTDGKVGRLAGSIITVSTGRNFDAVKQYVIPTDPPAGFPAGGTLLIATSADLSGDYVPPMVIPPDYVMPVRFLPTDGGTIDLDGKDPWTFDSLPIEGSLALLRSGATTTSTTHSFAAGSIDITFGAGFTSVSEYYNADFGEYFYTASEPALDGLESGRIPGWKPTGYDLAAFTGPTPECCSMYGQVPVPVCQYYVPPAGHFFSAFAEECDAISAEFPSLVLETRAAFYVVLPKDQGTGECPWPFRPVYRLWNESTNAHIFVDDLEERLNRLTEGWIPEGYGPGVAWCE